MTTPPLNHTRDETPPLYKTKDENYNKKNGHCHLESKYTKTECSAVNFFHK